MVTCRHNLGSFNRWIAIEQIIALVCTVQHTAPSHLQNVWNHIWYSHC